MNYVTNMLVCLIVSVDSIGWWSMAQLAAQDYFTRLQASGLSAFPHPADLAAAFPGGLAGMTAAAAANNAAGASSSSSSRQNNGDSKGKGRKEKKSSNSGSSTSSSNNNSGHNNNALNNSSSSGGLNLNAGTSSSPSSYKVTFITSNSQQISIHHFIY